MHQVLRHQVTARDIELLELRSDRSFPRHSHDGFGFGYLLSGGQDSWSGRGLVSAGPGEVITVNPGEMHDGRGRAGAPRHWRMLFLPPEALAACGDLDAEAAEWQQPVLAQVVVRKAVARAFEALMVAGRPDEVEVEEALLLAIRSLLPTCDSTTRDKIRLSRPVARVLDLIASDWGRALTLTEFAAHAGMSRYAFLRRFTREIGATPHAYLTQHRVKRARDGIAAGAPIAEAALAAGFADQSHLTRAFQRQFGLPPGRYRAALHG